MIQCGEAGKCFLLFVCDSMGTVGERVGAGGSQGVEVKVIMCESSLSAGKETRVGGGRSCDVTVTNSSQPGQNRKKLKKTVGMPDLQDSMELSDFLYIMTKRKLFSLITR